MSELLRDLKTRGDSPHLPFIVGNPQECAEQIGWYADAGVDEIVIRFDLRDQSCAAVLDAIERFGREVIPLVGSPEASLGG